MWSCITLGKKYLVLCTKYFLLLFHPYIIDPQQSFQILSQKDSFFDLVKFRMNNEISAGGKIYSTEVGIGKDGIQHIAIAECTFR
jgi:hypothetical protein